jgi:hypothetical protein
MAKIAMCQREEDRDVDKTDRRQERQEEEWPWIRLPLVAGVRNSWYHPAPSTGPRLEAFAGMPGYEARQPSLGDLLGIRERRDHD